MKHGTGSHRNSPTRISQSSDEMGSVLTDLATGRLCTIPKSSYAEGLECWLSNLGERTYNIALEESKANGKLGIDLNCI